MVYVAAEVGSGREAFGNIATVWCLPSPLLSSVSGYSIDAFIVSA